ncbi:MAG: hypothetical protein ACREQ1_15560, partial [Woeseiaceae bacterium]
VVLLGSLLAMGYLLPPAIRAFYMPPSTQSAATPPSFGAEAPRASLIAIAVTVTLCVVLFFGAQPVMRLLDGFAR